MKKLMKTTLLIIGIILIGLLVYVGYLLLSYSRIPDNQTIVPKTNNEALVPSNTQLKIVTFNIGYGSYSEDFTFFMDGGKEVRARSEEEVTENISNSIELTKNLNPDIILFQEVDIDADRSYKLNEYSMLQDSFSQYNSLFAQNYNSAYLFYPFTQPIGKSKSGIGTFSRYTLGETTRRSLPISESLSKFIDLDRCFTVTEMKTQNNKSLWLYNVHLTAYGGSEDIASSQIKMIFDDATQKTENGDYVIIGGDFNHDLPGDSVEVLNNTSVDFGWAQPFPREKIPKNFIICDNYKETIPTARNLDIPYDADKSFTIIIDGFIVSDNIKVVNVENIYDGFSSSDHGPAVLDFILLEE